MGTYDILSIITSEIDFSSKDLQTISGWLYSNGIYAILIFLALILAVLIFISSGYILGLAKSKWFGLPLDKEL